MPKEIITHVYELPNNETEASQEFVYESDNPYKELNEIFKPLIQNPKPFITDIARLIHNLAAICPEDDEEDWINGPKIYTTYSHKFGWLDTWCNLECRDEYLSFDPDDESNKYSPETILYEYMNAYISDNNEYEENMSTIMGIRIEYDINDHHYTNYYNLWEIDRYGDEHFFTNNMQMLARYLYQKTNHLEKLNEQNIDILKQMYPSLKDNF